jgi:diguanylate cyclase (GGDEF)-like protein
MPSAQAWSFVLICVDATAIADRMTGPHLWLGPVYLIVISLASWSLGWIAGEICGVGCMGLTFAINGMALYPYGRADFASNLSMRLAAVSIVIAVIAGIRRTYVKEWWRARSDPLTGAMNRQAFFEFARELASDRRWRLLVYADLDGLKRINDLQGHEAGDACLKAYGSAVRSMIRHDDIFARVGGDEFVLLFAVKYEADAKRLATRLHKGMNAIAYLGGTLKCSVGGLLVPPGESSIDDLVRRGDKLMYEAKLRGAALQLGVAPGLPSLRLEAGRQFVGAFESRSAEKGIHGDRRAPVSRQFARRPLPR